MSSKRSGKPRSGKGRILFGGLIAIAIIFILLCGISPVLAKVDPDDLIPPNGSPLLITVMYPETAQSIQSGDTVSVLVDAAGVYPLKSAIIEIVGEGGYKQTEGAAFSGTLTAEQNAIPVVMPAAVGGYTIVATVTDDHGYTAVSNVVNIQIVDSAAPVYEKVEVTNWKDVEQVAKDNDVPVEVVVALNPDLIPQDPNAQDITPTTIEVPVSSPGPAVEEILETPDPAPGEPIPENPVEDFFTGLRTVLSGLGNDGIRPAAPLMLSSESTNCQVSLVFMPGEAEEAPPATGYFVYRNAPGMPNFERITSLQAQSGEITFHDTSLPTGSYIYYVASFNSAGETMGDLVRLDVTEEGCDAHKRTSSKWSQADFTVPGNITDFYCYVSMLGSPWTRIPLGPTEFMNPDEGGLIEARSHMPTPVFYEDEPYRFGLDCWGWSGDTLIDLGTAEGEFTDNGSSQWATTLSNENFSFIGVYNADPTGLNAEPPPPPEEWYVPEPTNVEVIAVQAACEDTIENKVSGKSESLCGSLMKNNVLITWDWNGKVNTFPAPGETAPPTIETPDRYILYRVEPRYLGGSISVKSIEHADQGVIVPKATTEECYFLKTAYRDKNGYSHFSIKSEVVCVPPQPDTGEVELQSIAISPVPTGIFTLDVESYELTGTHIDHYVRTNCSNSNDEAFGWGPTFESYISVYQSGCYGYRKQLFTLFDLGPIIHKQISSATLVFTRTGDGYRSPAHEDHATCASAVQVYRDPIAWTRDWEPGTPLFEASLRDFNQSSFSFNITNAVYEILQKEYPESTKLLFGIVPAGFVSKSERRGDHQGGNATCEAPYGGFQLQVEYFDYSEAQ